MDAKKTGQLICESRKQHGMSQKDLADILNITDKAVSKWERGISFPDISLLIPLSEALEISLYNLLSGGDHDGQK
jgi:transcriptional regulator with XRE-family HTH domain